MIRSLLPLSCLASAFLLSCSTPTGIYKLTGDFVNVTGDGTVWTYLLREDNASGSFTLGEVTDTVINFVEAPKSWTILRVFTSADLSIASSSLANIPYLQDTEGLKLGGTRSVTVLRVPVNVTNTWKRAVTATDSFTAEVVGIQTLTTSDTFNNAARVESRQGKNYIIEWFAPGKGLVKSVCSGTGCLPGFSLGTLTLELQTITAKP